MTAHWKSNHQQIRDLAPEVDAIFKVEKLSAQQAAALTLDDFKGMGVNARSLLNRDHTEVYRRLAGEELREVERHLPDYLKRLPRRTTS